MAIAATEHGGQRIVFRASGNNDVKLKDAREALGLIDVAARDFSEQVSTLASTPFSPRAFSELVKVIVPGEKPEVDADKRALAHWKRVQEKRDFVHDLYRFDERVMAWTGTALGAWQAFNTYDQHERKLRGSNRVERNQLQVLKGQQDRMDASILATIMELAA
jgi:hypothetical protein